MAGKIIADTIETGAGADISTSYVVNGSAKAWLYAQQRTATVEAKSSLNVSSWVDDTTGKSTTNLTNAMSNTYYNILVSNSYDSDPTTGHVGCDEGWPVSSSQLKQGTFYSTASYYDCDFVYNSIQGDLA